jgi:hypothetical protein
MITTWVEEFHKDKDANKSISKWRVEGKIFQTKKYSIYSTFNLSIPYIYVVSMISRLYGEPNDINFKETRVSLIYIVTTKGVIFNWATTTL